MKVGKRKSWSSHIQTQFRFSLAGIRSNPQTQSLIKYANTRSCRSFGLCGRKMLSNLIFKYCEWFGLIRRMSSMISSHVPGNNENDSPVLIDWYGRKIAVAENDVDSDEMKNRYGSRIRAGRKINNYFCSLYLYTAVGVHYTQQIFNK